MTVFDFLARRDMGAVQVFPGTGPAPRTVMISSHIWWTELIAYAVWRLGHTVVAVPPWYSLYVSDAAFAQFDAQWDACLDVIRQTRPDVILGGNSTAMVVHPRTGDLLHRAAGVPLVNYWWDEPRCDQPMHRRGLTLKQYVAALADERTLNVVWDVDVTEELRAYLGLTNVAHVPLGTTPEFWPVGFAPLESRQLPACFLGNCHGGASAAAGLLKGHVDWSSVVLGRKVANPDLPMVTCVGRTITPVSAASDEAALRRHFQQWSTLAVLHMLACRNAYVQALAKHLGDRLVLIGKGWDALGLTPRAAHSGVPKAAEYYANSQVSLNLFGGCVHGGMPLRPYEIAASHGLIVTQYTRELPDLFEPGKECVAFGNVGQMLIAVDHILSYPRDFNHMVHAARKRVVAQHSWEHRMGRVLSLVDEALAPARAMAA